MIKNERLRAALEMVSYAAERAPATPAVRTAHLRLLEAAEAFLVAVEDAAA